MRWSSLVLLLLASAGCKAETPRICKVVEQAACNSYCRLLFTDGTRFTIWSGTTPRLPGDVMCLSAWRWSHPDNQ